MVTAHLGLDPDVAFCARFRENFGNHGSPRLTLFHSRIKFSEFAAKECSGLHGKHMILVRAEFKNTLAEISTKVKWKCFDRIMTEINNHIFCRLDSYFALVKTSHWTNLSIASDFFDVVMAQANV